MKKHMVLLVFLLIMSVLLLSGCNETPATAKTDEERIIGMWKGIQYYNDTAIMSTYIFTTDNTFNFSSTFQGQTNSLSGTWAINNNTFIITSDDQTTYMDYLFSENDTILTIIENGSVMNLIKQSSNE